MNTLWILEDEPEYYCRTFATTPYGIPVCASADPANIVPTPGTGVPRIFGQLEGSEMRQF